MIRKAIIVAFVLAAAATAALWIHVHSKGSGSIAYVAVLTVQDVHIYLADQTVLPCVSRGGGQKHVWLPFWLPLVLFGSYPIVALIRGPVSRYYRPKRPLAGFQAHKRLDLEADDGGMSCPRHRTDKLGDFR